MVVEEGQAFVLKCNPPTGIPPLQIYWMTISERFLRPASGGAVRIVAHHLLLFLLPTHVNVCMPIFLVCLFVCCCVCTCTCTDLQHIEQDERVSMSLDGDLYFSHAEEKDSRRDYCCVAAFPTIRTIVQKTAMSVVVTTSRCRSALTFPSPSLSLSLYKKNP